MENAESAGAHVWSLRAQFDYFFAEIHLVTK